MLAVNLDCAAELCELALRGSEHMTNLERNGRARRIDLEGLVSMRRGNQGDCCQKEKTAFHDRNLFDRKRGAKARLVTRLLPLFRGAHGCTVLVIAFCGHNFCR